VAVLLWRQPVASVWVFVLPSLVPLYKRRLWTSAMTLVPVGALVAMGGYAWRRGAVDGLWLVPWEVTVAGLALILVWLLPRRARRRR